MARTILPFDEISALKDELTYGTYTDETGNRRFVKSAKEYEDELLDILILAYLMGYDLLNDDIGADVKPDAKTMKSEIYKEIDGKTFADRVKEYVDNGGTVADIIRIAETESHRVANVGAYNAAHDAGAKYKTWNTMMDDRVRDAHIDMENQTVGIDEKFYTIDGAETDYPGGFGIPELDINCRCFVTYSM